MFLCSCDLLQQRRSDDSELKSLGGYGNCTQRNRPLHEECKVEEYDEQGRIKRVLTASFTYSDGEQIRANENRAFWSSWENISRNSFYFLSFIFLLFVILLSFVFWSLTHKSHHVY